MLPAVVEHLKEYFPNEAGNILWPFLHSRTFTGIFDNKELVHSLITGGLNLENWRIGSLARICLVQQEAVYPHLRQDARNLLLSTLSRPPLDRLHGEYPDTSLFNLALAGAWAEEFLGVINQEGWEGFRQLLSFGLASFSDSIFPKVRESLICLFHFLGQPEDLIFSFQGFYQDPEILEFCIFCYCSYYFKTDELTRKLNHFFDHLAPSERIDGLKYLVQHNRSPLANSLAERLLSDSKDITTVDLSPRNGMDALHQMADRYYRLVLLELAGRGQEARDLWVSLESSAFEWNAGLFLQKSQALNNWDGLVNFQQSLECLKNNAFPINDLLGETWRISDRSEFPQTLPEDPASPFVLAQKYSQAAEKRQAEQAGELADQILNQLREAADNDEPSKPRFLFSVSYNSILDQFIARDDLKHAEAAATLLLKILPGDPDLFARLALIKEKLGQMQGALEFKLMESAMRPNDRGILKQLSEYFERNGNTAFAYRELKKLSELVGDLSAKEQLKLAELAYESGNFTGVDNAAAPLLDTAEGRGTALVVLGKTRMQQGFYDEAVSFFRQAVEENPYSPERWVYLVNACRKDVSEEWDVFTILQEGLGYLPESSTLHSEMAREYYIRNQMGDVMVCLEQAVSYPSDTREGVITVGTLMTNMGDVRKAYEYYLDVLKRFDYDIEMMRLAALAAMETEDFEGAEEILLAIIGRIKPSADDLALYILARLKGQSPIFSDNLAIPMEEMAALNEKMDEGLQLDPEHLGINLLRAEMKAYLGDYEGAREIFTRLIEHDNTSHWKTLGGYGYTSMKLGDLHTAMAALQESYSINPEQLKLEQYLAEVYLQAGLPADAKGYADKLFFRKPNDLNTLLWYADFNGELGHWESVVSALINAYHLNPGDPEIMMRLAEGFVRTDRAEDARHLARLLRNMPDQEAGRYFKLANLMAQMSDWQTAVDLLELTIERGYSPSVHVYFALAMMHQKLGNLENAVNCTRQALKAAPDNRYVLSQQADILYAMDKPQAALISLEQAEQVQQDVEDLLANNPFLQHLENDFQIRDWVHDIQTGIGLVIRKSLYLRKLNRYAEAYMITKTGYSQTNSEELLVLLYDLSLRSADFHGARSFEKDLRNIHDKSLKQAAFVLYLRVNCLLGNTEAIKTTLAEGSVARYNTSEWHCAQCLISQSENNWDAAVQSFKQARTVWANKSVLPTQTKPAGMSGIILADEILQDQPYWIWMTAASLLLWDDGLNGLEAGRQIDANHGALQFGYLKALTLAGEWSMLSEELELEKRKPSTGKSLEETRYFIQGLASTLAERGQQPEIRRWITRANILFSNRSLDIKGISEQLQMPEDLEFLAGLLRNEKKFNPAAEIATKLSRHFKNNWQQALCYLHADREKAAQVLRPDLEHSTGFPLNLIVQGQIAEKNEDYPAAYQAYRKAVNIWKDEPKWLTHCANLAEKCGDQGSTVLHLKKALDLGYRKLETAMKIGKIHQDRSEFSRVIDILEPLYREGAADFSLLMNLGNAHLELGDSKKAFEFAEQARDVDPKSAQPYLLYARISGILSQHSAAMEYARKALELKPGDEEILVELSRYIEKAGNADEAFQLLENVVVSGDAGRKIINEYVRQKKMRSGAGSVLQFLENLREKGELPDELHAALAEAYFSKGQDAQAEREAAAALKTDPSSTRVNFMLAVLNHRSGQLDLASHYAAQAIQLDPADLNAYFELADIYHSKNEPGSALEVYNRAIKANPQDHQPYFKAGLLLRKTRNYQEAEVMLKQAAKLAPDDLNIRRQLSAVIALNMVHQAQEEKTIP